MAKSVELIGGFKDLVDQVKGQVVASARAEANAGALLRDIVAKAENELHDALKQDVTKVKEYMAQHDAVVREAHVAHSNAVREIHQANKEGEALALGAQRTKLIPKEPLEGDEASKTIKELFDFDKDDATT